MDSKVFTVKFTILVLMVATGLGQGTMADMHSSAADVGKCSGDPKLCDGNALEDFDVTNQFQVRMKTLSHVAQQHMPEGGPGGGGVSDDEEKEGELLIEDGDEKEPQEPGEPQEDEEPEEPEEPEDSEKKITEEQAAFLQQAFGSLQKHTVDGRVQVCPKAHYLAGLVADNDTDPSSNETGGFTADCKPCAKSCSACYGGTMRQCYACDEPLLALLVHEKPHPTIGCVKECPTCYSPDEGICVLDRTCEDTAAEGDVYVPVPNSTSSLVHGIGTSSLVQEEDEKEEEQEERTESRRRGGSGRRRSPTRRRSVRRRTNRKYNRKCRQVAEQFQNEIDGWRDDCFATKLIGDLSSACDRKNDVQKKINTYKNLASVVKQGTQPAVQNILAKIKAPYIGAACKGVSNAFKAIHPVAKIVEAKVKAAEKALKKFDKPCEKIFTIYLQVDKAAMQSQAVLDKLSRSCGCNCVSTRVDGMIELSGQARDSCTNLPSMKMEMLKFDLSVRPVNLYFWVEDILAVIEDIVNKIDDFLDNTQVCVPLKCLSMRDIVDAVSFMLEAAYQPMNAFIKLIFGNFGLPCSSIETCMDTIVSKYLDQIPGVFPEFDVPSPPSIPTLWFPNVFPMGWNLPGCGNAEKRCMAKIANSYKSCRYRAMAKWDAAAVERCR